MPWAVCLSRSQSSYLPLAMHQKPSFLRSLPSSGRLVNLRLLRPIGGSLAALSLGVLLLSGCMPKPRPLPMQIVLAQKVVETNQVVSQEWIGTLTGSVNTVIRANVGGYLISQDYKEGDFVKAGQVLFHIDPRTYQATLDQAKGNLAAAQATALKSQQDMIRYKGLVTSGAVSQQEYQNEVQVNQANEAQVAAAQGTVDSAQLNLGYTQIKAAVEGVAGIAQAQVGNLIGENTEMTTVSNIDPIKAVFNVSEQLFLNFMQTHPELAQQEAAQKNAVLELILSNGDVYGQKGTLDIINRQVNQDTGTIQLIGLFPNSSGILRPGSFVRVRMTGKKTQAAILVPQRAVTQVQTMYVMAIVTPSEKDPKVGIIKKLPVEVGNRTATQWAITSGLKSGDTIVVEGTQKVRDGEEVAIEPYVPPNLNPAPTSNIPPPLPGAPTPPAPAPTTPAPATPAAQ